MKYRLLYRFFLIVIIFSNYSAHSQTPNWIWAERAGGIGSDFAESVATDHSGNIFLTGNFSDIAAFGDTTLASAGESDIFVARYDGDGNLLWAERAGGTGSDYGRGVATDGAGNVFLTGYFADVATFGDTSLTSGGEPDLFVARYNGDGNLLWAERAGGASFATGVSIVVESSGNCLVTGSFKGVATFGENTILTSAGESDLFIARYDGDGNLVWAEQAGGTSFEVGTGITSVGSGSILVTGWFGETATFEDTTLTSAGELDIFVAGYDANGNFLWAERAGGSGYDGGAGIAEDGSGGSLVTGSFYGAATFGDTTLTGVSEADLFIARYDGDGNFLWAEQAGGTMYDAAFGIAADGAGTTLITGEFEGSAIFGDTTLISVGESDLFVARYDVDGNLQWAERAGGAGYDFGESIAVNSAGNGIVAGWFDGMSIIGDTTLTSADGSFDIFVAKFERENTAILQPPAIPGLIQLYQNYPNPFNPVTTIRYDLTKGTHVVLKVYNMLGQEIRTLVDERQTAGEQVVAWDGRDRFNRPVSSGIYFYRIQAGEYTHSRKMLFVR